MGKQMIWPGEKDAWDRLGVLLPDDVIARTGAAFDQDGSNYKLTCLGQEVLVLLKEQKVSASSDTGRLLINGLGEYSRLSILRYLIAAKDTSLSGKLVKPADLPGGDFFLKGSHVLPLDKIIKQFENRFLEFIKLGKALGGTQAGYGDVSLQLWPFQKVPIVLILWAGDDDFSGQASLLFDSSCSSQMATDVLWSTAMMTVEMMVKMNSPA
jgi:hypothetical protein